MKFLLLVALTCAVSIDGTDMVSNDGSCFLSLRPTESESAGTAWFIQKEGTRDMSAYTGKYQLDNSGPVPAVRLQLSHCWVSDFDEHGNPWWTYDYDYHARSDLRYGVSADYETTSDRCDLSVIRAIPIDLDGDLQGGSGNWKRYAHLEPSEVVSFEEGTFLQLSDTPPPGFVERTSWKNRVRKKPDTIYRTNLLEEDWYGWNADHSRYVAISLKEGKRWDSGNARILVAQIDPEWNYVVGRAKFEIDIASHEDALLIYLPVTRFYEGSPYSDIWRVRDTSEEATGLTLCTPLDDRALREGTMTLRVWSTYYVDDRGNKQKRYNDDAGFFRPATTKRPESALQLKLGDTLNVRPGRLFASNLKSWKLEKYILNTIEPTPPPGFQLRPRKELQFVGKVVFEADAPGGKPNLVELRKAASQAYDDGNYKDALNAYKKLIETDPSDRGALEMRGRSHYMMENYSAALEDFTAAINIEATATLYYWRGSTFEELSAYQTGLLDYKRAYSLDPDHLGVLNNGAWLWATCPDAEVRDGRRAVLAAKRACELTNWRNHLYMDTLAAAYAESGDFGSAVRYQEMALDGFSGKTWEEAHSRLEKYRRREPYREP